MRPLAQAVLLALIGVATAASAQTRAPRPAVPLPPPTIFGAPTTPAPVAPPTNPGSAIAPPAALSPLLSNPGAIYGIPERAGPSYPASPVPAPVDQQKMQSYRNDLINQRFQLDRQSVSPDNRRYREIQRQLNQPGLR
jgi:hypothetical protein